jgi:hypothetical protein
VYRYCIKSRYPRHAGIGCNSAIEHVAGDGDIQQHNQEDTAMAIWTRQQTNGRMIGFGRIVGVAVGTVAIGAALVAGGLGWQSARAPQTLVGAQQMEQHPLGIDLPQGADVAQLPRGLTDYIRPSNTAQSVRFQATSLGITLPAGTNLRELPRGLTDYVRPQPAALVDVTLGIALPPGANIHELPAGLSDYIRPGSVTPVVYTQSSQLGIDLPQGADAAQLPRGLTDYVRPQHAEAPVAASSAVLGITMPTGAQYTDLPRGVTDYLRANK